jgi:uncharacterized iron-regulated protein
VPERVYDTRQRQFVDFEVMIASLFGADVIFVGEQHDDPNTHRLEHALLEGMARRRRAITLSFEMFERDVQDVVQGYLRGAIPEQEFLERARPWPRYATDYRALLEFGKTNQFAVIAANVPRRLASDIARSGPDALGRMSAEDRALVAKDLQCPQDAYFDRFAKAMTTHTEPGSKSDASAPAAGSSMATTSRYYWSQCVKDETMAESIAKAATERPGYPIVHFNGAFHSDFGQGTVERTRRRLQPGHRVAIITILPVADLDKLAPRGEDLGRADYLVYTVR